MNTLHTYTTECKNCGHKTIFLSEDYNNKPKCTKCDCTEFFVYDSATGNLISNK